MPTARDLPDGLYRVEQRFDGEGVPKFTPLKGPRWLVRFFRTDWERCDMLNLLDRLDREEADA